MDATYDFGPLTRRTVLKAAVIGSAGLVAGGVAIGTAPPALASDQAEWRWCHKCQGLWFGGNRTQGRCPAGGGHSRQGSGNYILKQQENYGQTNWRWCHKCQGMWFAGNGTQGRCPVGRGHSRQGSGNYGIQQNVHTDQTNWRWCRKCQGMWFAGNGTQGRCPAGRGHSLQGSGDYSLRQA